MAEMILMLFSLAVTVQAPLEKNMPNELVRMPPLAQGADETRQHDAKFDKQCRRHFKRMAGRQAWKVGETLTTHSPEWGMIWRADFNVSDFRYTTGLINRFVCWKAGGGAELTSNAAFGQRLQPLKLR
jgi:hypothetical protein